MERLDNGLAVPGRMSAVGRTTRFQMAARRSPAAHCWRILQLFPSTSILLF